MQGDVSPQLQSVTVKYLYSAPKAPTLGHKLDVLWVYLIFLLGGCIREFE
jgi:hypothetical protein